MFGVGGCWVLGFAIGFRVWVLDLGFRVFVGFGVWGFRVQGLVYGCFSPLLQAYSSRKLYQTRLL